MRLDAKGGSYQSRTGIGILYTFLFVVLLTSVGCKNPFSNRGGGSQPPNPGGSHGHGGGFQPDPGGNHNHGGGSEPPGEHDGADHHDRGTDSDDHDDGLWHNDDNGHSHGDGPANEKQRRSSQDGANGSHDHTGGSDHTGSMRRNEINHDPGPQQNHDHAHGEDTKHSNGEPKQPGDPASHQHEVKPDDKKNTDGRPEEKKAEHQHDGAHHDENESKEKSSSGEKTKSDWAGRMALLQQVRDYAKGIKDSDESFVQGFVESVRGKSDEQLKVFAEQLKKIEHPQRKCPVTEEDLGSTGSPEVVEVKGKFILVCCSPCSKKVQANPEKYINAVNKPRQPNSVDPEKSSTEGSKGPSLVKQTKCPITGGKLDSMGGAIKVRLKEEDILVCCDGCVAKAKAEPETTLKKVHDQTGVSSPTHAVN